jgi:hypothetical protein
MNTCLYSRVISQISASVVMRLKQMRKGKTITLQHSTAGGRVTAKMDASAKKGTATIEVYSSGRTLMITDRNITDN